MDRSEEKLGLITKTKSDTEIESHTETESDMNDDEYYDDWGDFSLNQGKMGGGAEKKTRKKGKSKGAETIYNSKHIRVAEKKGKWKEEDLRKR